MKKLIPEIIVPVEGQTESWCHLAPIGEFSYRTPTESDPNATGTQLLDKQALENLVKVFSDSVLVDREHLSIVGDDTTAMGWIEALELRADGLYARIRWTDLGLDNIRNRRLRWLSPVWELDSDNRPLALDSAGLTNTARFKNNLQPVVNKIDNQLPPQNPTPNGGKAKPMDKTILEMLGLSAEATAEDVQAAIKALQDQFAALNKESEELKSELLTGEAEKVADENEDKIANKESFVKLYVANKENALALLACVKAPVLNKADAKKPPAAWGKQVLNKLEQYQAMSPGREKDKFLSDNKDELLKLENQL